jgi:ferredoxin
MCHSQDGTIVAAHSNLIEHGKGMGSKAHDGMAAWLCHTCHSQLDQGGSLSKQERAEYTMRAICRTYMCMWDKQLIEVVKR